MFIRDCQRCHDAEIIISWDQIMDEGIFPLKNLRAYCCKQFDGAMWELAEKYGNGYKCRQLYRRVAKYSSSNIGLHRKLKMMNKRYGRVWNIEICKRFSETVGLYAWVDQKKLQKPLPLELNVEIVFENLAKNRLYLIISSVGSTKYVFNKISLL